MIETQAKTIVARRPIRWSRIVEWRLLHSGSLLVIVSLLLVLAGYMIAQYALMPGNSLAFFPFIYDDYLVLTNGLPADVLHQTRPIYLVLAALITSWGMNAFYLALAGLSVLNAWLILRFVFWICRRPLSLVSAFIFALVVYAASVYVWAGKYNVLTNHFSMLFGVLAMFALAAGAMRSSAVLSLLGIGLFALSIFAKEDYFLAVLCVAAFCLLKGGRAAWRRNSVVLLSLLAIVALFLWQTLYLAAFSHLKFGADAGDPYAQRLSIPSMVATFVTYVRSYSLPTTLMLVLFGVAVIYGVLVARRQAYYLILAIIVATVLPYTLLPNHVTAYNAINWIPWMVAFMLVLLPSSLPGAREVADRLPGGCQSLPSAERDFSQTASQTVAGNPTAVKRMAFTLLRSWLPGLDGMMGRFGLALLLALVAIITLFQTHDERTSVLAYFGEQSAINHTMVDELLAYQPQLAAVDTVGIVGADRWSPWLKTQAEFLTKLGFNNRWLIFVPPLDFYHVQQAIDPYDPSTATMYYTGPVTYLRLADLERHPDIPLLVFGEDGHVVSWGTSAHDFFRKCLNPEGDRISKKCLISAGA